MANAYWRSGVSIVDAHERPRIPPGRHWCRGVDPARSLPREGPQAKDRPRLRDDVHDLVVVPTPPAAALRVPPRAGTGRPTPATAERTDRYCDCSRRRSPGAIVWSGAPTTPCWLVVGGLLLVDLRVILAAANADSASRRSVDQCGGRVPLAPRCRSRRSVRRSRSLRPPHTPCATFNRNANSRHSSRTGHRAQTAFVSRTDSPRAGKKSTSPGCRAAIGELLPGGREIGFAQDVLGEVGFGAKSHQRRFSVALAVGKKRTRV